jgi:hypothetical protein
VTFDTSRITSVDWRSYPILRFQDVPAIDIVLIDHPDQPAWGAGEITATSHRQRRSIQPRPAEAAAMEARVAATVVAGAAPIMEQVRK